MSLEEIIQFGIISSKNINLQYLGKVYCRELRHYLVHIDALEKKYIMRSQIPAFKNCNKLTPGYKDY